MTKYLNDKFSVDVGSPEYREGWDRIFNKSSVRDSSSDRPRDDRDIRLQVLEFRKHYDQSIGDIPALVDQAEAELQLDLVEEEVSELRIAFAARDLVGMADALADIDYVVEGFRCLLGIRGGPIANEVHRSNMSKLGEDGKPIYREDGKVLKGPNYSPPDIAGELRNQGWDV